MPAWYVFVSKIVRVHSQRRLLRSLLVTSLGTAIAGATVWSTAGMVAMGGTFASGSVHFLPKPQFYAVEGMRASVPDKHARIQKAPRLVAAAAWPFVPANLTVGQTKSARHPDTAGVAEAGVRLEDLMKKSDLGPETGARLFDYAVSARSDRPTAKVGAPAPERFGPLPGSLAGQPQTLLAFADPSPTANGPWSAVLAGPSEEEFAAPQDANGDTGDDAAALPDYEDSPSVVPLPQLRPLDRRDSKPAAETEKANVQRVDEPNTPKADESAKERETPTPRQLAYARPANPAEKKSGGSLGGALRNLFGGGAKAGHGVAVYDISAAKVYMPDGSVLEAHSGIGKMADNPRYVNVKMHGPTPPHTYDLKMRESRFHGVEALRMLPVDGKNRNGRNGLLTHSYLLRGGRAESHGCVAFKDYARFLSAFKQGKVRQLVVVPSGGRASVRLASAGNSI